MSNPSKRKGTSFEVAVVDFLRTHGFPWAHRKVQAGSNDEGDIQLSQHIVLECKSTKSITLASFVDEAVIEAQHADVPFGAAVVKRIGKNVSHAYVVMPLCDWVDMALGYEDNVTREEQHGNFKVT